MGNYYPIMKTVNWPSESDTPQKYYSTDTEIYWLLEEKELEAHMMRKDLQAVQDKPPEHSTKQRKSRKSGFQLRSHKLRRIWQKYYFKCQEKNCNKTFNALKVWNIHHSVYHKMILKCESCPKKFRMPNSLRVHWNTHMLYKFTCECCGKQYPFRSAFQIHRRVHSKQQTH